MKKDCLADMKIRGVRGFAIVTIALFAGISFWQCGGNRLEDALIKYAEQENKTYPRKIDNVTQIDSCIAIMPNILQYKYKIVVDKSELDTTSLQHALKQSFVQYIRTDRSNLFFVDNKVNFEYRYYDEQGNYVFGVNVNHEDYSKK